MYRFYWYPKCSTCKKAKAWLDAHHIDYQVVDMIADTPSAETIEEWLTHNEIPMRHKRDEVSGVRAERSNR